MTEPLPPTGVHELPPLSLYVHIPWCVRKCPYCDFNSHESRHIPEPEYVQALLADLALDQPLAQRRPLKSIFFGGGTPSLFSARAIHDILAGIEQQVRFSADCEITLEANPGTTECTDLKGFRAAGVNRLSFGVQSFNDLHLQQLGRIHDSRQALTAIRQARQAGFTNINLDLMHGLPGQSLTDAMADLQQAIELAPEHLSWYQLTIEPNTAFYKRPPTLPPDETLADIQDAGHAHLEQQGFGRYEISAYSQPGREARHNINYWEFGDYLAIGAGAHGKITTPAGRVLRYQKTRRPEAYLAANEPFNAAEHLVDDEQLPVEFMMNALRLVRGVPRFMFSFRTGLPDCTLEKPLARLRDRGLMVAGTERLQTTELGLRFLNDVLAEF